MIVLTFIHNEEGKSDLAWSNVKSATLDVKLDVCRLSNRKRTVFIEGCNRMLCYPNLKVFEEYNGGAEHYYWEKL